jgi:hypothetical protein
MPNQPDTRYNGYTNWATWNIALWIDNEEPSYHYRRRHGFATAADVEAICRDLFPYGTPDMEPADLNDVNYQELADLWSEED